VTVMLPTLVNVRLLPETDPLVTAYVTVSPELLMPLSVIAVGLTTGLLGAVKVIVWLIGAIKRFWTSDIVTMPLPSVIFT
jgi:hypothetical protein